MCGRYSIFLPPDELEDLFGVRPAPDETFVPHYNAAPGQSLPVVTNDRPETLRHLRWGLVPSWADDEKIGNRLINARSETVAEKPAFREAYRTRRCLVLADGFYEWKRTDGDKQPYRITRADGEPFAMAGLWETWKPPQKQTGLGEFGADGPNREVEALETFTIVTTEPSDFVRTYHDRMAVVLPHGAEEAWLESGGHDLLRPYEGDLRAYPVSTAVNNPTNDSPAVVEEVQV
jgi:putative SOS response-associated peptidase YedK